MFVAKELRKKSIAEYLLYMWQIEDIIRVYGCSLTRIRKEYIDKFDYTNEQKEEEEDWFGDLVRMMNQEGCREGGHLQINKIAANLGHSEVETCFDVLYGVMMLRLQKKEISRDTETAVKEITTLIGMLSDYYQKDKTEGLQFED